MKKIGSSYLSQTGIVAIQPVRLSLNGLYTLREGARVVYRGGATVDFWDVTPEDLRRELLPEEPA